MKGRITQTGQVYFDPGDDGRLFVVPLTGTDRVVNGGDPYVRTIMVGQEWMVLDTGHVKQCSLMVLINERTTWDRNPTDDQRVQAAAKVVEISHGAPAPSLEEKTPGPAMPRTMFSAPLSSSGAKPAPTGYRVDRLIHPGEHDKGVPVDLSSMRVRCQSGTARCTLYLFPS